MHVLFFNRTEKHNYNEKRTKICPTLITNSYITFFSKAAAAVVAAAAAANDDDDDDDDDFCELWDSLWCLKMNIYVLINCLQLEC